MSKGAVNWPGAKPAFNNVRPLEGGLGAMRATARGMMNQQAQRPSPRGLSGVPYNASRPMFKPNAKYGDGTRGMDNVPINLEQILAGLR
jgi:hypothetical protein